MDDIAALISRIAQVGKAHPSSPNLTNVAIFQHFFSLEGNLLLDQLDNQDGSNISRRELITRFLLLNAVMDQGPDILGVRQLLIGVTNALYQREIRFLHKPLAFFQEFGIAIDQILASHQSVKALRAEQWARENRSKASRYNLFVDNARQALGYAVFRWGVPLALPLLLEKDQAGGICSSSLLLDYLESYPSAEQMASNLKDHRRYGLGKAIGDKACHLFAKWLVSLRIVRRKEPSWGEYSFEVPYDSNAGRVLWRTGYLLAWASEEEYADSKRKVIQHRQGKGGLHYLRVTNIRGMATTKSLPSDVRKAYNEIVIHYLMTHKRLPNKIEIQKVQQAFLLLGQHTVANFDDGLIHIGTHYCMNHDQPRCDECPLEDLCLGHRSLPVLIHNYRT